MSWAAGDISTSDGAARLCDDIVQERHASPLVLVYAAGVFGPIASIAGSPIEEWRSVIDTNLLGAFYTTRLLLPHMLAAGWGRIVYVSSKAAIGQPGGGASAYAISKIGLNRLSSEVAAEVAGHGVTANSIHPGEVKTAMWADITDKARRAGDVGEGLGQWSEMVATTGGDPVSLSARMVMWLVGHPEVNGEFLLPEEWERSVDGGDL